jgi:cyclomaltodextrinase / maltogenic alpha-amylase / neopullulanase
MHNWSEEAVFYHIYPLGYCGAPERNEGPIGEASESRLKKIEDRLGSMASLGVNALYLGPLFESVAHGYDTVDYRRVDRRLGSNEDLASLSRSAKARGMRVVLDGVFNHVGREGPWFKELLGKSSDAEARQGAAARFSGVDFSRRNALGDPFCYDSWRGCLDLPKLNLANSEVRESLIGAALSWIDDYDIDGIRLDAADCLSLDFIGELASRCRARKPGFWLLGEIVHGDYRRWTGPGLLDSVTNYECWKGLWSSLNDSNYFEIAYALKQQFGGQGIYRDLALYNFADNHDVDRAASLLGSPSLLYPLYALLFTMPGIPSIYYGSEFGARGKKAADSDRALRPSIEEVEAERPEPDLARAIARLAALRRSLPALRLGAYREILVRPKQLVFSRECAEGRVVVALNADEKPVELEFPLPFPASRLRDELEAQNRPGGEVFEVRGGRVRLTLHPFWARALSPF